MSVFEEFQWRDVLFDSTEGTKEKLENEKITAYCGFDPTGSSLHVGSLMPIMSLARLQRFGHSPIAIVGGGTGLIGDPSGKTKERMLLTTADVDRNLEGIREQLSRFLDFEAKNNPAQIVNNYEWLGSFSYIEFLRDVGKHISVNNMMAKESVKRRLASDDGISYTEFSYLLLQAYDFVELFDRFDCKLQVGGSDQWGNIVSGTDLIRRMRGGKAYGLVHPLVTTTSGIKFGKTEAGAVWLDAQKTSPYRFYQFWLNAEDADVIRYLKYFTWLSREEIEGLEQEMNEHPERRQAQRTLAKEVTILVHGETALESAERASRVLFGGSIEGLSVEEIVDIFQDVPSSEQSSEEFAGDGINILDLLASNGLVKSRGEGRRLLQQGGVYVNNEQIRELDTNIDLETCINGQFLVLRKGRKNYHLVKVV